MVYRGNTLIPLRNIAEACGTNVEWNAENRYAQMSVNNRSIIVANDYIEIDGARQETVSPVNLDDRLYLDTKSTKLVTEKNIAEELNGAVVLYEETPTDGEVGAIFDEIAFSEPTPEEILEDFKSYNPNNAHPRILIDGDRLEKIKKYIKSDSTFAEWYANVKKKADKALTTNLSVYELRDGERLLYVSRDAHDNIIYPAFAYLIDGDREYFERAVAEMMAVAEFADWHPTHFLDTAEMTLAVALGYDWLYDSLSKKQKGKISTAILRLGLDAANEAYEGTAEYSTTVFGAYHNRIGWKDDPSNWGLVCNGGITAGALAVMGDVETEYCAEIVSKALKSIKRPLKLFAPDGAWSEGIGYWSYACNYLAYMLSSVKNTLGTNYDYTMIPGILATANFPIYHIGPKGMFNFGDASEGGMSAPILFWFASELGEPSLNNAKLSLMEKFGYSGGIYDILFYDPELPEESVEVEKDKRFRITETAISTNSSSSTNANYIAVKGGTVGASHGDLDAGTFVIDAIGERWAMDLGSDSYTLPGYFEWPHRGNYYRKRAEGHSTLVLNPDGGLDQKLSAKAVISDVTADTYGACSVVDLSSVYQEDAKSARRASVLFDNRSKFMIQDEVTAEKAADVYWFMQTNKEIEIAEDGKSLVLSDGNSNEQGKRMKMILQSNCNNAVITYGPAEPLAVSPQGEGQTKNSSVKRIQIKCSGVTNLNLQVIFIPYLVGEGCDDTDLPQLMTIDDLLAQKNISFKNPTYTELDDLAVDGETVEFFDPMVKYYEVNLPPEYNSIPNITASGKYNITVTQPESSDGMAKVTVSDPTGVLKTQSYYITFKKKRVVESISESMKELKITGVEASDVPELQNPPENTIDNDIKTKWAANGSQWIKYDLGSVRKIGAVGLQWLSPISRIQRYSIEMSADGNEWQQIYSGTSLGTTEGFEYVLTDSAEARYVRVSVNGNTAGTWTSLMETKIFAE